jgi:BMFP domain-containing protein YqiC
LRPRRTIAIVNAHGKHCPADPAACGQRVGVSETVMVQTTNRFFDEVARLMNDAAGAAQGVRREFETLFRTQAERILSELDVVRREDFEAVKEMARIAREENEALKARVAALEARLGKSAGSAEAAPSGSAAGLDPGAAAGPA